ncbi:hypothetical protein C4573_01945 [Candidatus Woesearchaeota archaeon]|nr:MAG: hypothetical protein C4573_01945 [Candidatus Woesearchaeota archaeon]
MKDDEESLKEDIADLKSNLKKDGKKVKEQSQKKVEWKKIIQTAMPFLLILMFIIGFLVGYNVKKDKSTDAINDTIQNNQNNEPDDGGIFNLEPLNQCSDSDKGINVTQQGEVYFNSALFTDSCHGNQLKEYYCDQDDDLQTFLKNCEICEDGACLVFEDRREGCTETDNYVDYELKGYVLDRNGKLFNDSCSSKTLEEAYCDRFGYGAYSYKLCDKCEDGRCVPAEEIPPKCNDTDGGIDYYTKGTVTDQTGNSYTDNCQSRTLEEYYCSSYGNKKVTYKLCHNDCVDGACIEV